MHAFMIKDIFKLIAGKKSPTNAIIQNYKTYKKNVMAYGK